MASLDNAAVASSPFGSPAALRLAPALYALTMFASALLLFAIQPMFTKMVLPRLGGAPAVWSVAMVFFQAALLAGYAYAHALTRFLSPGRAALVHLGLLALAAMTLPIAVASGFGAPPTDVIPPWLFALFAASIGLPFVALAASAPLLQSWFAASGHRRAANPYVLYAASNLGSFAALITYPAIVEPLLTLKAQTQIWSAGFAALATLVAAAALFVARRDRLTRWAAIEDEGVSMISWSDRLRWSALAAVPSGLVIAVTAYLTTDIAAAPFLWVIPLALYLLTFVAVFRERPWISQTKVVWFAPFVMAPLSIGLVGGDMVYWFAVVALNIVGFVMLTLLCHGELYGRRPDPRHLTEFYLWVSVGGVVGGAFAGLLAPHIFSGTFEYPLLAAAAFLAMPGMFAGGARKFVWHVLPVLTVSLGLVVLWHATSLRLPAEGERAYQIVLVLLVGAMLLLREQPARFFSLVVLAFVLTEFWRPGAAPVETARSFFGVHRVVDVSGGKVRLLYHGTTVHGAERLVADDGAPITGRPEPLTYYYFGGPISEAIAVARQVRGRLQRVAAVGLGTGSLACHRVGNEDWTFFEIDPEVARIARDPRLFRFMSHCAPDAPVVLGDARLTLEASQNQYDLIVLDAFSSDAIPVHLLTREAVAGYLRRLQPNGVIVVHISNRHLELGPVVGSVAKAEGLAAFLKLDSTAKDFSADFRANSHVAVLARGAAALGDLPARDGWHEIVYEPSVAAWTDDYSNIVQSMWRKKIGQ